MIEMIIDEREKAARNCSGRRSPGDFSSGGQELEPGDRDHWPWRWGVGMMHQRPAQVEANARTWYKWKAEEKPSCRREQQNQEIGSQRRLRTSIDT